MDLQPIGHYPKTGDLVEKIRTAQELISSISSVVAINFIGLEGELETNGVSGVRSVLGISVLAVSTISKSLALFNLQHGWCKLRRDVAITATTKTERRHFRTHYCGAVVITVVVIKEL